MELGGNGQVTLFTTRDDLEPVELDLQMGTVVFVSRRDPSKNSSNEDAALVFELASKEIVLAVADGVGGERAGGEASRLALSTLAAETRRSLAEGHALRAAILDGFEASNREVMQLSTGAATTLAVVEIREQDVRPYHVGDSCILVVGQRGKLKAQTIPHSPTGYGVEAGLLDEHEAMIHEDRHVVSNVVGEREMRIEVGPAMRLASRDTLLVASDGLWDNLRTNEIIDLIRKGPLTRAARELGALTERRMSGGGEGPSKPDDLTFLLYRGKSDG